MSKKWFDDVFMKSLFGHSRDRAVYISGKQREICSQYMDEHIGCQETFYGGYKRFTYYTYTWNQREIQLGAVFGNGYSRLTFGMNPEEQAIAKKAMEAEEEAARQRHIEFLKRNPDRLQKWMDKIHEYEQKLDETVRYMETNPDDEDMDLWQDEADYYMGKIAELKHKNGID